MERLLWAIVMVMSCLTAVKSDAQNVRLGITGGTSTSNFNGVSGMSSKHGFVVGGFMEYHFIGGFAIQPQVLFSMKGASGIPPGTTEPVGAGLDNLTLNYIEIPVLLKYDIFTVPVLPITVDLYAGPDFALNLVSEDKTSWGGHEFNMDNSSNTHPIDFNIAVGGGPNLDLGTITLGLEVRYTFAAGPIFKNAEYSYPYGNARNEVWSVLASVEY